MVGPGAVGSAVGASEHHPLGPRKVAMASLLKRILVGSPLASSEEEHQRLGKPTALAVFASDAISSTAYATQEMLFILMTAVVFPTWVSARKFAFFSHTSFPPPKNGSVCSASITLRTIRAQ